MLKFWSSGHLSGGNIIFMFQTNYDINQNKLLSETICLEYVEGGLNDNLQAFTE